MIMSWRYAESICGTVLTKEFSFSPTEPDCYKYPFPDDNNAHLHSRYRVCANAILGLLVCVTGTTTFDIIKRKF